MSKKKIARIILPIAAVLLVLSTIAGCASFSTLHYQDRAGVAIHGYDPVAYFEQGAPKQGSSDFVHTWGGATWRFTSKENLDVFAADPTGFAPQFGGYCAWAVAQNSLAEVDPEYWAVVDGKLYLNKNLESHGKWRKAQSESIAAANQNWPELSAGLDTVAE